MPTSETVLTVIVFLVMLTGVAGTIIPVLPDLPLIWLAALVYGLLAGFDGWVGGMAMLVLTLLALAGIAIDIVLGPVGARRGGASWEAIAASLALSLVGLFFFPPIGPVVGAIGGLFLVEYYRRNENAPEAWSAVKGYLVGCGWSVVLKVVLAGLMIVTWGVWVWLAARG